MSKRSKNQPEEELANEKKMWMGFRRSVLRGNAAFFGSCLLLKFSNAEVIYRSESQREGA